MIETQLKEIAAESELTIGELSETADKLEEAIQSRLLKHFKRCHLEAGRSYWILDRPNGAWLAFNEFQLHDEMKRADIEFDPGKLKSVASAHLDAFQAKDITIAVPGPVARSLKDPFFFPIFVEYPDGWDEGQIHSRQQLQELVSRYDCSPAEALDYWAVEEMYEDTVSWGGKRNVKPEAVRKNVRQAKEKLKDDDLGATHEDADIRPVRIKEVPAGDPHDPDKDIFYVPTEETVED